MLNNNNKIYLLIQYIMYICSLVAVVPISRFWMPQKLVQKASAVQIWNNYVLLK